jgi:two-component system, OmpR family, copper resistance phosphate regulon response regulator CusR
MRVLIVEDEKKAVANLSKGLTEHGFEVVVETTGDAGLRRATEERFDLIVLDVMLPGRDGWSVLEELKKQGQSPPVLLLTARDAVTDRVKCLDLGADDYIVKPFAFAELLARMRAILRRTHGTTPDILRIADLEIDFVRQKATRAGQRLELTPRESSLLMLLARRRGEVLTRPFLAAQVWDVTFDGDSNFVDVHVRRLRAKVDDPFELKLIHTVRGVGYVLDEHD